MALEINEDLARKYEEYENLKNVYLYSERIYLELQQKLAEIDSAINELSNLKEGKVYKMVETILIEKNKDDLLKELNEEKEAIEIRLKSIKKQLDAYKERLSNLYNEIEKMINKQNK